MLSFECAVATSDQQNNNSWGNMQIQWVRWGMLCVDVYLYLPRNVYGEGYQKLVPFGAFTTYYSPMSEICLYFFIQFV